MAPSTTRELSGPGSRWSGRAAPSARSSPPSSTSRRPAAGGRPRRRPLAPSGPASQSWPTSATPAPATRSSPRRASTSAVSTASSTLPAWSPSAPSTPRTRWSRSCSSPTSGHRLPAAPRAAAARGVRGFVLQISAVVAERPLPRMAAYSASKAAERGRLALRTSSAQPRRRVRRPPAAHRAGSGHPAAVRHGARPAAGSPADVARGSSTRCRRRAGPRRGAFGSSPTPRPGCSWSPARTSASSYRRPGRLPRPRRRGRRGGRRPRAALARITPVVAPSTYRSCWCWRRCSRSPGAVGTWLALAGGLLAVVTTAAVAARPTAGFVRRRGREDGPAARLDRADRVRTLGGRVRRRGRAAAGLTAPHGLLPATSATSRGDARPRYVVGGGSADRGRPGSRTASGRSPACAWSRSGRQHHDVRRARGRAQSVTPSR